MNIKIMLRALLIGLPVLLGGLFALAFHQTQQATTVLANDVQSINAATNAFRLNGNPTCTELRDALHEVKLRTTTAVASAVSAKWTLRQFDQGCLERGAAEKQLAMQRSLMLDRDMSERREQWAMHLLWVASAFVRGQSAASPLVEALARGEFDLDRHMARKAIVRKAVNP